MRTIQGALIVASSVQIILGYSQLWAICSRYISHSIYIKQWYVTLLYVSELIWRKNAFLIRFFSPLGMAPVISLVGFGLLDRGFPVVCLQFQMILFCFWLAHKNKVTDKLVTGWKMCRNWHSNASLVHCLFSGIVKCLDQFGINCKLSGYGSLKNACVLWGVCWIVFEALPN